MFYVRDLDNEPNTYANVFSFMGLPLSRELSEDVDAVILGIPYDLATSGRSGARMGPTGIRQASAQLRWEEKRWPWTFHLADKLRCVDYGDICFTDGDSDEMLAVLKAEASKIFAANKTLLSFGGDHFLTLPLLRAAAEKHGQMALIHFDAHTDTEASEAKYNHGSMFYHAPKEGLIKPENSIQVGIRTEYDYDNHPFQVLDAAWVNEHSLGEVLSNIKQRVADMPVYLSFDIDCLDPAYAPGTGTPVSGGLSSDRALQIVRGLQDLNIVAADVMEVAPAYDHAEVTSLVAATLALELLHVIAAKRSSK
ncbi:agmatinase [uncultured Pseudoteredinibacter sp.]|uniref:agmatinase n=1 Tax=uncultured Pseudoteredinibacter sp. TaxID=1641701 RepID=UPI0026220608|nr:agmatinase [uncultured Pseudoteredinibacter sp.]